MKIFNLLVLILSFMVCTACAQQGTVPENMGVTDAGETDSGAPVGNETVPNGTVQNEEANSSEQGDIIDNEPCYNTNIKTEQPKKRKQWR